MKNGFALVRKNWRECGLKWSPANKAKAPTEAAFIYILLPSGRMSIGQATRGQWSGGSQDRLESSRTLLIRSN